MLRVSEHSQNKYPNTGYISNKYIWITALSGWITMTEHHRTTRVETALKEWIRLQDTNGYLWVTLTLKETHEGQRTDAINASRSFRHFHNRISQIVLKTDYRKRGKKIRVIPFLESKNGRLHYHCAIENPTAHDQLFLHTITKCWNKSPLGLPDTHAVKTNDDNWVDYALKHQSNNWNTVDYDNLHLG